MEAHDVRVVEALVNGDLRGHLLSLVLLHDHGLGYDLACEHLVCLHVRDLVALGEAPLAQEPAPGVPLLGPWVDQHVWDLLQGGGC